MRKTLLFCFIILVVSATFAQQKTDLGNAVKQLDFNSPFPGFNKQTQPARPEKCGFNFVMQNAKAKGYNEGEFEKALKKLIEQKQNARTNAIYTVPVVFHIVHRGEAIGTYPNISATQVAAQISQLNKDFANLAGSTYPVASDAGIRFCAAVVDPAGHPLAEPGIQRINGVDSSWANTSSMSLSTVMNYFNNTIKPKSIWDPYSFINVWTADISFSGLLGYATFPSLSTLPGLTSDETDATAGTVIEASSVGSTLTPGPGFAAPYNLGRTLTHELGHFFGLRHIWGDATCGNDYCNDTPPQNDETSGCPAPGTLNGCTPSMAKMFENFMDYTNDACMNTYTADQTTRVQAVMVNSPRRMEVANSKACQSRVGNTVQFNGLKTFQTETGSVGTCPLTKTVAVSIAASVQATGNATLTFTHLGTASNGADYTISPSSVSFTNGDNTDKIITITIIDDKAAEAAETIAIGYTISGTGIQVGPDKQIFIISITDDDFERRINNASPITLFSQDFNSGVATPAGWTIQNGFTNGWAISANGSAGTTGNALHITQNPVTKPNTYDETSTSQAYAVTPLIDATGLTNIGVSFKWRCGGEADFDEGYLGYITETDPGTVNLFSTTFVENTGTAVTFNGGLPALFNNTKFRLVFFWLNDDSFGDDPGFTVDDIVITAVPVTIESTATHTATLPQYSSQTVQYISGDNQIIARVTNSSENIGCITAVVQNAGTGRTSIQTPGGNFFRTNKVVRLTPTVANTTATYQATFYFTSAELSPAWAAGEIPNLKILKVRDGVNLSGLITGSDAQLITPTFADNIATGGHYAYTGNFTQGFSQFMLVSPTFTLPVGLITFEAQPARKSIELTWKTAQEKNNKGFVIERSSNGADFTTIGWVAGVGTTDDASSYKYSDNFVQPNTVYYYRLKQTDFDNRTSLSNIRQAKITGSGLTVTINPNPVKGQMTVFVSGTTKAADISLVNAKGQIVGKWTKAEISSPYQMDVTRFAKGYYNVIIHLDSGDITRQVIIE
jgi:hypothetical protein